MSHWQTVALGDVCTLLNGRAYKKNELLSEGKYPVLRVGNFFSNRKWYYSDLELEENKYCDNGDLLYAWSASFGPRIWEGEKVIYHYHIWKTKLDDKRINKRFLYYWFDWDTNQIKSDHGAGSTMIHVTKSSMEKRKLRLPPLPEQKRIVAILDKAFEGIDTAIANTEKNLANARELFESVLNQMFNQTGEGWVEHSMSDICKITSKLVDPREGEYIDLPHVGAGNMESGTGGLVEVKTAREEKLISGKFVFDESMVLYSKIRPYLMKVCKPDFVGLCSADVYPLSPIPEKLDRSYLFYLLLSKHFTDYAISGSERAGMPKVNRTHLFKYTLNLPCLEKQREYAKKIELMSNEVQMLERLYTDKRKSLIELKQSILNKAFSGELTTIKDDELRTEEVA